MSGSWKSSSGRGLGYWNRRHTGDDRLASIRMIVYREQTLPDGSEKEPLQGMLWNQVCVLDDD